MVLGMHRSGTSVLAGTLKILGVSLGDRLIEPGADNPRGYFEQNDILQANIAFLESFGLDRDGILGELPVGWLFDERTIRFKEVLKEIIQTQFKDEYIFGFKDPRISILLPAYIEVLESLQIEIRCVVSEREVAEVATSLQKRNNIPLYVSIRAFQYYYRIIDEHTKNIPTVRVSYQDLFDNRQETINAIIKGVHHSLRPYVDVHDALDVFIDTSLKHNTTTNAELVSSLSVAVHQLQSEVEQLRVVREKDLIWWQEQIEWFKTSINQHIFISEESVREKEEIKRKLMFTEAAMRELERVHAVFKNETHNAHLLTEKHREHLEQLLTERDTHIHELHGTITNIERSVMWKAVKGWDMVLSLLLPKDTIVRQWYESFIRFNQKCLNEVLPKYVFRMFKRETGIVAQDAQVFWQKFKDDQPVTDVLFVNHEESRTGAPRIVFDVANETKATRNVSMVSVATGSMRQEFANAFGHIIYPQELYPLETAFDQATKILQEVQPKMVYVNSIGTYQFARAAKALGIPVVFHVHELSIAFQIVFSKKERASFKDFADVFIAVSQPVYDLLVDTLQCPKEKVQLIHAFVDRKRIHEQSEMIEQSIVEHELQKNPGEVLILCVGMFVYRKGADVFMDIAKRLSDKGLQCRFVWIGSRPFKEPFMSDFNTYAPYFSLIQEKVNPFPYLKAADIFVLPSREDPFPLVVLEAMALGKPTVLFSDAGGIQEAVKDSGIAVPDFNTDIFTDAIERLVVNPADREMMGSKAAHYQEKYDSTHMLPKITKIIDSLLEN